MTAPVTVTVAMPEFCTHSAPPPPGSPSFLRNIHQWGPPWLHVLLRVTGLLSFPQVGWTTVTLATFHEGCVVCVYGNRCAQPGISQGGGKGSMVIQMVAFCKGQITPHSLLASSLGVLLDRCAHRAYFWVLLYYPDPEHMNFLPQNWVLHGCCGCRTAIQLLVDCWLPVCFESSGKQNLGIKQ